MKFYLLGSISKGTESNLPWTFVNGKSNYPIDDYRHLLNTVKVEIQIGI